MKKNSGRALQLFRKMLEVLRQEQGVIKENNLDKIEYYSARKRELRRELHEAGNDVLLSHGSGESIELESLIKEIAVLNKENTESVLNMRNDVMSKITGLHKGKAVFRAYNSCA